MRELPPTRLPTAASQLVVRRPAGRLGPLEIDRPGQLARTVGILAGSLAAAVACLAYAGAVVQGAVLTAAVFLALHFGLGNRASWRATLGAGLPAAAVSVLVVPSYPAFGTALFGGLAGWAAGAGTANPVARLSVVLGTGIGAVAGSLLQTQISHSIYLASLLPYSVVLGAAGAAQGAAIGLGTLPRHLPLERDPVEVLYDEARLLPGAEMRDYLERSMRLYRQIRRCLSDGIGIAGEAGVESFRENLEQLMTATFRLARRWREIELFLEQADAGATRQRLAASEEKLASLTDGYARKQYEAVAESLNRRLVQLDEMVAGRERVVGSLSYYFTTLEDMLLSLMRLKASDAQSASLELNTLAGRVRALNSEMEATARSVEELDFDTGAPTAKLPA